MQRSFKTVLAISVSFVAISSSPVFASSMEDKLDIALHAIEKLSEDNKKLRERLTSLENARLLAAKEPSAAAPLPLLAAPDRVVAVSNPQVEKRLSYLENASRASSGSLLDRISINGYSSFEFERQVESDGFGDPNGSFDADLFDIVLNVQINDKLRAAADVTWEHGSASEEGRGNVALEYGFAEYSFTDAVKLRAGKMFTPFGFFNEIHTAKPAYLSVKEAGSTNKPKNIIDNAPRFYPRWGVGIALQGNSNIGEKSIDYNIMLSNGEQEDTNPFEEDNNKGKAVAFRTRYDVADDLQVGYSLYFDNGVAEDVVSHGMQFEYTDNDFRLLGEGVWGDIDPVSGAQFNHYGWFIQPSYSFDNGATPYFRFEHYDPNTDISDDHGFDAVFGVNFNYNDLFFKLENNYYFGADGSTLGALPGNGYNEIKGAIVVGF